MGLDICVRKIIKKPKRESDYFRLIDDDGNYQNNLPEWTKAFERTKTETWYDWKKYKKESGIDIYHMKWYMESYDKRGSFMIVYPEDVTLPNNEDFDDYDDYQKELDKVLIRIDLDKVPKRKVKIKVLYYDEVGYQRKGLNGKFYDDYDNGKIGYFVWTLKELKRYKRNYCDKPYEYTYPNGEKSGNIVKPKENFQKNIIDCFTEGEDCVIFSW